jgi:hypothetical protein
LGRQRAVDFTQAVSAGRSLRGADDRVIHYFA